MFYVSLNNNDILCWSFSKRKKGSLSPDKDVVDVSDVLVTNGVSLCLNSHSVCV